MGKRKEVERTLATLGVERERNPREVALAALEEPADLAAYLRAEREALMKRLREPEVRAGKIVPPGGLAMAREFSDLMDAVVTRMYALACRKSGTHPETLPVSIVATGGYGRRELCPYSDIDITFIPQRDGERDTDRVIREMFRMVMDICIARCGLEVGYAYRLMEDCGSLDHQTVSGLLDARLITGSQRLFIQFEDAFWMGFNPPDFIFTKLEERAGVLQKWGTSPRVVEPNLKEGPGGLRDLQTAVWLVQARNHLAAARVRGERAFGALIQEANLSPRDAARLANAKERLFQVRNALHAESGAERDQLVVTRQEAVARLLGYAGFEAPSETPRVVSETDRDIPPVETFMAEFYDHLALIRQVSRQVMERVGNSRLILGIGLDCKRRQIVPANEALVSDDPEWLLWACELAQKYGLTFSEDIERAASGLVAMHPVLHDHGPAAQVFTRILADVGRVYPILQQMADLGILGWFLPEFARLMNLIPYDPSHDHTVGQHTLYVIQNLESLLQPGQNEEADEMRRVLKDLPHPEQLMLAALLHDIGKAIPGRPHSEVGEEMATRICARLGWPEDASANVRFLVRHHLVMAETSRLRDLSLDETIRDFTQVVDDPDRLNMLYLLTYADTRAVGAGVWTSVKGRFLRDLWQRATAVLCEEEPVGYDEATVARARRRLLKDLSPKKLPEAELEEHMQAMPPNYLLGQSLDQIALHIGFVRRVRAGEVVIDFHEERNEGYTELTVCTYDDPTPGLLAKITGALYAAGLDVHGAQVVTRITTRDRIALDTLWVDYRSRPLSAGKQREVAASLTAVLKGEQTVPHLLEKHAASPTRRQEERPVVPEVTVRAIRNDLSDKLTVVETDSPDIRGALYWISDALSRLGWSIWSARVSFWQGAARTIFYVEGARHLSETEAKNALLKVLPSGARLG